MTKFNLHLWAALAVAFLSSLQLISPNDILWHIRLGEIALDTGVIPKVDIFSHTFFGQPMVPHAPWLDIFLAWIHLHAGWGGLVLATAALKTVLVFLMREIALELGANERFASWSSVALLWIASPQLYHPQLGSFVLFGLLLLIGVRSLRPDARSLRWVAAGASLALVWPLFHASFPVGIGLMACFGIQAAWSKKSWALLIATSLVALVWAGLAPGIWSDVVSHASARVVQENVGHWKPFLEAFDGTIAEFWILANLLVIVGTALLSFARRRILPTHYFFIYVVVAGTIAMTLSSVRFFPLLVVIGGSLTVALLSSPPSRLGLVRFNALGLFMALSAGFFLAAPWTSFGLDMDRRTFPSGCIDFIRTKRPAGEMFNSYSFGGSLIYGLRGNPRVYIDSRVPQLYPDSFFKEFLTAYDDPTLFERIVTSRKIGYTVLKPGSAKTRQLLAYLDGSPQWKAVYRDSTCVLHVRTQHTP